MSRAAGAQNANANESSGAPFPRLLRPPLTPLSLARSLSLFLRILAGATIGANSRIAANALVAPGASIGSGELWAGSPASLQRSLDASEIEALQQLSSESVTLSEAHDFETCKSHEEVFEDELDMLDAEERQDDSHWYQPEIPANRSGKMYDQRKTLEE